MLKDVQLVQLSDQPFHVLPGFFHAIFHVLIGVFRILCLFEIIQQLVGTCCVQFMNLVSQVVELPLDLVPGQSSVGQVVVRECVPPNQRLLQTFHVSFIPLSQLPPLGLTQVQPRTISLLLPIRCSPTLMTFPDTIGLTPDHLQEIPLLLEVPEHR